PSSRVRRSPPPPAPVSCFCPATARAGISTLSLHDALPISASDAEADRSHHVAAVLGDALGAPRRHPHPVDAEALHDAVERLRGLDRKSTRLNSSHVKISYAVFCLKKKTRRAPAGRPSPNTS